MGGSSNLPGGTCCHVTGQLGLLPRSSDNWRWSPAEPRRTTRTGLLVCGTTLVALDAPWRILPPGASYGHPALISQSHIDDRGGAPVPGPACGNWALGVRRYDAKGRTDGRRRCCIRDAFYLSKLRTSSLPRWECLHVVPNGTEPKRIAATHQAGWAFKNL